MEQRAVLSVREMELFILLGRHGATKSQAAHTMTISPYTVKQHLARVAKRIGSNGTANALHILICEKVIPVELVSARRRLLPIERVILEDVAKGFSNSDIAARAGMTLPQTQYAIKRLFKTMRANTRIQLVYRGHQTGHLTTNRRN
jgi:DNA-binding CsgD family transcriptional regulator